MIAKLVMAAALASLVAPPLLILLLPRKWLTIFVLVGTASLVVLWQFTIGDFETHDPGPAGLFILAYMSSLICPNVIAFIIRLLGEIVVRSVLQSKR